MLLKGKNAVVYGGGVARGFARKTLFLLPASMKKWQSLREWELRGETLGGT
jgi:hypothetical protein